MSTYNKISGAEDRVAMDQPLFGETRRRVREGEINLSLVTCPRGLSCLISDTQWSRVPL